MAYSVIQFNNKAAVCSSMLKYFLQSQINVPFVDYISEEYNHSGGSVALSLVDLSHT